MSLAPRPPASGFAAVLRAATAWLGLTGVALAATGPVVQHGPFEIRSVGQRVSAGGFPNTSGNPFTTREVTTFTVRWRGREVELARGAKSFYYVGRLVDAPQPALLVATTILTLVTEDGDRLRVESFGDPNSPSARSQWLDGAAGQPGPRREFGLGPVPLEDDGTLAGGRWLLIGHHTVLDVQTLRAHAVQPWVASGNGARLAGASASNETARALSPGQTRYVLPTSVRDRASGRERPVLLWVDLRGNRPTDGLVLDRTRTPFAHPDDLDASWIARHFSWQRDASGDERLVERSGVTPAPWRGRLRIQPGGTAEYRVPRARPALLDDLRRVVLAQPGAVAAPSDPNRVTLDGCEFGLSAQRSHTPGDDNDSHVAVYRVGGTSAQTAVCAERIRQIAAAFDAELASGRHAMQIALD